MKCNVDEEEHYVEEEDRVKKEHFKVQFSNWALRYNVPHSTLGKLLSILCPVVPGLPTDPRTLLGTTRKSLTKPISFGIYFHSGIKEGVLHHLDTFLNLAVLQQIILQINIDGLPIQKSSERPVLTNSWPHRKTSIWDTNKQNTICNRNFLCDE